MSDITTRREQAVRRLEPSGDAPAQPWTYRPDVDILDLAEAYLVVADVPGAREDRIDVTFEEGVLSIQAEIEPRHPDIPRFDRHEFGVGHFHRRFTVGDEIDIEKLSASYENGVLSVRLPKAERQRRRRVPVTTS